MRNIKRLSTIWLLLFAYASYAQVTKESIGWAFANLTGISYWAAQNPFCDAFKTAKRWDKSPAGQGGLDQSFLDANGWVTSFPAGVIGAECLLFTGAEGRYPTGNYVLTWTGGAANGSDITTLTGQLVKRVVTRDGTINISALAKGAYLVKIGDNVFKLIKE